uniref:Golgin subfamily A conserved domain-containing protein n=1 Tax=Macaca nemestrina TaxID=9545 RepID=A0A2K6CBZ7_MACNE
MAEETRQSILAEAKKKLKEYWHRNSPGGPAGAKKNRKTNGSSPETATSGGSHSPGDTLSSVAVGESRQRPKSSVLGSLRRVYQFEQQKKQVEHQLEEEKKANNEKQKTERELQVQIQRLNRQIKKLNTDMNHTKRSLRYFEEESKDLAGHLQQTLQCIEELEQALSAVPATQEEKEISFSSRSQALIEWQLERSIQEKARLKAQLTQMKDSLKQAHLERDEYAQHLKGERAQWQQRMRKMWQEVCTLKKEKKDDTRRVEELKRSLSKLKNQMAKPLPPEPPAVPSDVQLQHLRKELERVSAELQAHLENHQHVSLLNQPQKERLGRQEERFQQLAEPQSGNNENKSALQLEQQVEELQEKLDEERLEASSQQSQQLNAPLNLTALPGEGDGGEHLDSEEEEGPRPMPSVPEDQESWEAMTALWHHGEMADLSELVEKPKLPFIEYWGKRCHSVRIHQLLTEAGQCLFFFGGGCRHHQVGPAQGGDEVRVHISAGVGVGMWGGGRQRADTPSRSPAPQELVGCHNMHGVTEPSASAPNWAGEARGGSAPQPHCSAITQEHQRRARLGQQPLGAVFLLAWLPRRR